MQVLLNDLPNLPHHDGQKVLHERTERFELEVNVDRGVYWYYLFALKNGQVSYTRMARLVAREMVRTEFYSDTPAIGRLLCLIVRRTDWIQHPHELFD